MEPNWKNILKNTFSGRTIQPNPDLWQRLENQLENQSGKTSKRKWIPYGVAAGVVLILGIFIFLKNDMTSDNQPVKDQITINSDFLPKKEMKNEVDTISVKKERIPIIKNAENQLVNNQLKPNRKMSEEDYDEYVNQLLGEISSEKIIAQIGKEIRTDSEIDSIYKLLNLSDLSAKELLLMATTEATLDNYIANKYNSDKILSEIEKDNFKERVQKVLDRIISEYKNIRMALNNKPLY